MAAEDKWSGMLKIDCPACGKPVGQIHKDKTEDRVLVMRCPQCGHSFDYEYPAPPGPREK